MVCQRCQGLLVWGALHDPSIKAGCTTLPHDASIVGIWRMPSFVPIVRVIQGAGREPHAGGSRRATSSISRFSRKGPHRPDKRRTVAQDPLAINGDRGAREA